MEDLIPKSNPFPAAERRKPICLIVLGMAGTGKTTFTKELRDQYEREGKKVYTINLDPAVQLVPYPLNIDIRETVNYKKVMKQYQLGPNGAIMTALNLYSTRFDQVLELMEKRAPSVDVFLIDTPGQIEVFTWSASGQLITEALSASFPTSIVYLMDAVRCQQPVSFMSNMMYACSVMYKAALPFLVTFNKTDAADVTKQIEWAKDADNFAEDVGQVGSYVASLARSSSLVLEEFYRQLPIAAVSAATGDGFQEFFKLVDASVETFHKEFVPWKKQQYEKRVEEQQDVIAKGMAQLSLDRQGESDLIQPASKKGLKLVSEE